MTSVHWPTLGAATLAGVLGLLVCAMPLPAMSAADDTAHARGLIVRLTQAPAHEDLNPRAAHPRLRELAAAGASSESLRWQRVLAQAGLAGASGRPAPRLQPVGRDQVLLDFQRPLSRGEAAELSDRLRQRPEVEWVEPNRRERRLQAAPNDPLFPGSLGQWWLQPVSGSDANAIDARLRGVAGFQAAWGRAAMVPVVVAVLDTGITSHPDLAGRVLPGHDFVSEPVYANDGNGRDSDPSDPGDWVSAADLGDPSFAGCSVEDSSWHGTIVAGMVAAHRDNGIGGAGVDATAQILPVRVAGKCGAEVPDIVDGMRWAAGLPVAGVPLNPHPARIVSISFGGNAACGPAYQAAVDELRALGVVVVAAAGNDWSSPSRPASCAGVVGVAGLNRDGFKTNYSNFGAQLADSGIATVAGDDADGAWGGVLADSGLVTLTNPGRTVPQVVLGNDGYARLYGTSFAVPQVSGTIALMLGLNPQLSHAQIVQGLRLSARPHATSAKIGACSPANPGRCICSTDTCGAGILDAEQALIYATLPNSYVPPRRAPVLIDNVDVDAALALAPQDRAVPGAPPAVDGGGGGGAFGGFWLLALATAALALRAVRLPSSRH
ncbi:MAG: S8 family serine peptidase [Rubrivivax sp.]